MICPGDPDSVIVALMPNEESLDTAAPPSMPPICHGAVTLSVPFFTALAVKVPLVVTAIDCVAGPGLLPWIGIPTFMGTGFFVLTGACLPPVVLDDVFFVSS